MRFKAYFKVPHCDPPRIVGPETLEPFSAKLGISDVAPDRCSSLLLFQTLLYVEKFGIDPNLIVAEIKALEGVGPATRTKPGMPFHADGALAGLQHKHFTSSSISMVASNILAACGTKVLTKLASEELGSGCTEEALARFVNRVVGGYDDRASAGKLTGEWIVFLEHEGQNYYLCLATHGGGDDEVLGYIRNVCYLEFPFLKTKLPHLFVDLDPNSRQSSVHQ